MAQEPDGHPNTTGAAAATVVVVVVVDDDDDDDDDDDIAFGIACEDVIPLLLLLSFDACCPSSNICINRAIETLDSSRSPTCWR